jgi:hypothetical protein
MTPEVLVIEGSVDRAPRQLALFRHSVRVSPPPCAFCTTGDRVRP